MPTTAAAPTGYFTDLTNLPGTVATEISDIDTRSRDQKLNDFITYAVPSAIAGFADTFFMSIGVTNEEDVTKFLKENWTKFGDYYSRNREEARLAGDMVGMFIPGMIAMKAVRTGSVLARAVGADKSRMLGSIFASGKSYDELLQGVRARDLYLAQQGVKDFTADTIRRQMTRNAMTTRLADVVRETVAFEAGVYGTMNESDVLYPDEFSVTDLVMLNAAGPAIFTGAEMLFMRKAFRQSMRKVADIAAETRDPANILTPETETIFRPGARDVGITLYAQARNDAKGVAATADTPELQSNMLGDVNLFEKLIRDQVENLGHDTPLRETGVKITNKVDLSLQEKNAAIKALDTESTTLLNTISVEKLPSSPDAITEFMGRRDQALEKIREKVLNLNIKADKEIKDFGGVSKETSAALAKMNLLRDEVQTLQYHVIEATGDVSLLKDRRPMFSDSSENTIKKVKATQIEPAYYEAAVPADPIYGAPKTVVAVSEDGLLILPEATHEVKISNINVTKVIDRSADPHSPEYFRNLLHDIGEEYHFVPSPTNKAQGVRGIQLFQKLQPEVQREIRRWTSSSSRTSSKLRDWFDTNAPEAKEIYDTYAPLRARLYEIADEDGTIPLFRGESAKKDITKVAEDLVSMTSSLRVARKFGEQQVVRRVPVNDVVMVVGGLGGEFEYIVKGNTKRALSGQKVNVGYEQLTTYKATAAYKAFSEAAADFKRGTEIHLAHGAHHTRLDYALKLQETYGKGLDLIPELKLPQGWNSVEDLEFASLASKYSEYFDMRSVTDAGKGGALVLNDKQYFTIDDFVKKLNLPGTSFGMVHPVLEVFEQLYQQGNRAFVSAVKDLGHFKQMMQETAFFPKMQPFLGNEVRLRGRMMDIPDDAKPFVAIKNPIDINNISRDALVERAAAVRMDVLDVLKNARSSGGELVSTVYDAIATSRASETAKDVHLLQQGSQRASTAVATHGYVVAEADAANAMNIISNITDRVGHNLIGKIYEPAQKVFSEIRSAANKDKLTELNLFIASRRMGWDIKGVIQIDAERVGFELKDTKRNKQLWDRLFEGQVKFPEKSAVMPQITQMKAGGGRNFTPVTLSELPFAVANEINRLSQTALANTNALRRAAGFGPIASREFHVPAKNFAGQESIFLVDEAGNLRTIAAGRTAAEAKARADREIAASQTKLVPIYRKDIETYYDLQDQGFAKLMDFSDPIAQTGRAKGKQVGEIIEEGPSVLEDIVNSINSVFESTIRRTRAMYFEPQVNQAKIFNHMAQTVGSKRGSTAYARGQSIWQQYLASIFGNPTINPNEIVGRTYFALENAYDDLLNRVYESTVGAAKAEIGGKVTSGAIAQFNRVEKSMGEFNPFANATDYAERTFKVSLPPSMKKHMAKLSSLTTLLTLRLFETGLSILNLTSLGATMPPVIKALRKLPGEDDVAHASRIGAFGVKVGDTHGMFSPIRALTTTMHDFWTPEFREVMREAGRLGYFDQEVSEIVRTMTAPREGYVEGIMRKYTDMFSILSDKSEKLARGISFMTGYTIANRGLGLKGQDAFVFAHKFANDNIGDYRPNNRPRIFQGAVGMPLGLFQTFVWNYFQRIFGYIENKQVAALATQYATQASIFGASSVPGFQQFSEIFASNYDGSVNLVDGLRNKFGDEATDWFLYGTLSNLPKMFGADEGVAFYSRGDMNMVRVPGIWNFSQTPSFQAVQKTFGAIKESVVALREGGLNDQRIAEIISRYSINRGLRNAADIYSGYSVDRVGQVISDDTRSGISVAARLVGARPFNEAKTVEAFHRLRSTQMSQAALMSDLRDNTRSLLRSGKFSDEEFSNILRNYIKYGGNPNGIGNWLQNQIMSGLVEKSSLELAKALRDPTRLYDVKRLISAMSLPENDPEFK
jgi:hypothetical protein